MIPPDTQRAMSKRAGSTVAEIKGSHAVNVSQPQAIAAIITKAAHGVGLSPSIFTCSRSVTSSVP
jgi:hypothetical protein